MAFRIKDRVKFLAEASKILSSSLDYNSTLASIANLVVTNIIFNGNRLSKVMLVGDSNKLTQVIINLLDNSAKHNEWGKPIVVSLGLNKRNVGIEVLDEGIGIHQKDMKNLFQEFYKGGKHTKSGMGLGLFLAKKIIDKHKGKIKLISSENVGTQVKITLPTLN